MQHSHGKIIDTEVKRVYNYKPLGISVNSHSKSMNSHTKKYNMNYYKNFNIRIFRIFIEIFARIDFLILKQNKDGRRISEMKERCEGKKRK